MGARSRLGARLRALIASVVEPRFETTDAHLTAIEARLSAVDVGYPSTRVEHDLFALRQQMDEVLDLLRVQHTRIRALEEALHRDPATDR